TPRGRSCAWTRRDGAHEARRQLRAPRIVSCLTAGTPVRDAVVVALPPRPDLRAAAEARLPDAAIDTVTAAAAGVDRRAHQPGGRLEGASPVGLGNLAEATPRRELRLPQRLREPH